MDKRLSKIPNCVVNIKTKDYYNPLFGKMRGMNEEETQLYKQMVDSHPKVVLGINVFDL